MRDTSRRGGFTKKLILSMLLVGLLPLVIGLSLAFYLGMREIREVNGSNFQALAVETARRVDLVLADEQTKNLGIARQHAIITKLETIRDRIRHESPALTQARLAKEKAAWSAPNSPLQTTIKENKLSDILTRSFLGSNSGFTSTSSMVARSATRALFVTDILGRVAAAIPSQISYLHKETDWWKGAYHNGVGKPYIGDLVFDELLQTYTFAISVPVMDSIQYQAVGVLHRVYDAKKFFSPTIDLIRFGKTGHVMLIDSQGRVLSCPILATGLQIEDRQLIPLVTPLEPGWALAPSDGHGGQSQSIIGYSALPTMSRVLLESTGQAWHLFVWQSSEELFAPVYQLRMWIISFGGMSFVLLLILGVLVSRRVVRPIRELQGAAKRIAKRQQTEPIVCKTGDEIEDLAEEINQMNAQLKVAFSGLLTEVETKTQEVEFLRESTTQILDGIPDPIIMVNADLDVQYMNNAFKLAMGKNNGREGKHNFLELLSPDMGEQQQIGKKIHALLGLSHTDPSGNGEKQIGQTEPLTDPLLQHKRDVSSAQEQLLTIENKIFRYDWFPVSSAPGEDPRYGLVLRDATDEKRLQDELINSEKITSLGVLCSGIGHELNNPLVGVIGLAEAIQEEHDVSKARDHAKAIVQQGQRMAKVIRDLTGQVKRETNSEPMAVDLNKQVDLVVRYLRLEEEYPKITLQKRFQSDLPLFHGSPEEIRLVFFHVIKNALQAMEGEGQLTIETQTINEHSVEIRIEDTGTGISPSHLPKVFDPFFTTKFQGEGSGLGLTIVQRIVTKYSGRIGLESKEGQGTQCRIMLPCPTHSNAEESAP